MSEPYQPVTIYLDAEDKPQGIAIGDNKILNVRDATVRTIYESGRRRINEVNIVLITDNVSEERLENDAT